MMESDDDVSEWKRLYFRSLMPLTRSVYSVMNCWLEFCFVDFCVQGIGIVELFTPPRYAVTVQGTS